MTKTGNSPVLFASPQIPPNSIDGQVEKLASTVPFTVASRATALAIMMRNDGYIADRVMPRISVEGETFDWKQGRGEDFRRQDTRVGRTGQANRSEAGEDLVKATTEDFAWEVPVPQKDEDSAAGCLDRAIQQAANKVEIDREVRVRDIVQTASNYQVTTTLATDQQWSNYAGANSNPLVMINQAIAAMMLRPNTIVMTFSNWITLSMHPVLVRAFNGNDGGSGMITQEFFTSLFGLNLVLAESWIDTTSIDLPQNFDPAALARIWGNNVAILRLDPSISSERSSGTWGFTAEWMNRRTMIYPDPRMGVEGGRVVKVGEHVREIVSAKYLGRLFINAFV